MPENSQTLLRSVIASHFQAFLDRHSFKEDWYNYDQVHFGNEFLKLRSANFSLLFVNARGCLEIKICPVTDSGRSDIPVFLELTDGKRIDISVGLELTDRKTIDISVFLEFLGHPLDLSKVENYQGIVGAEALAPVYARALEAHFDTVIDLLHPQNFEKTQIQFNAFTKERGARLFGPKV